MARDGSNPWYENALLLVVAGSLIALIGQFAGTIIPIKYGAEDASDFSISVDPVNKIVSSENGTINVGNISVEDFHPTLRPYKFGIYLSATGGPRNATISFSPAEIKPGRSSRMNITFGSFSSGKRDYTITIQGWGGDGRKRTTTFILSCIANSSAPRGEKESGSNIYWVNP